MYEYTWLQWILFFFCYCFFGWIFESSYVSLKEKRLVNRGFLRLPMLPLYGTGAVMMLFVSLPVKNNLILVYVSGVVAATLLEYVTGWGMERLFKMRYWDYSNQRFQFRGYICLSSSIAWGGLTIFLTEVVHRPIERFVLGMSPLVAMAVVAVVGTAFVADTIESTRAALDLGRALEAMTRMKAEMEAMQVQLAQLKGELREQLEIRATTVHGEASQRVEEILAEAAARMSGIRESSAARAASVSEAVITGLKEELTNHLESWKEDAGEHLENWKEDIADRLEGWKGDVAGRLEGWKEGMEEHLENQMEYLEQKRQRARETAEKLLAAGEEFSLVAKQRRLAGKCHSKLHSFYRRGILLGNPTAFSEKHSEALNELREEIEEVH